MIDAFPIIVPKLVIYITLAIQGQAPLIGHQKVISPEIEPYLPLLFLAESQGG